MLDDFAACGFHDIAQAATDGRRLDGRAVVIVLVGWRRGEPPRFGELLGDERTGVLSPRFETGRHFLRRLDPLFGILFHHVGDDLHELFGKLGMEAARMPGRFLAVAAGLFASAAAGIRHLAAHGVVQGAAERIDIACFRHIARRLDLFGRQVIGRADDLASPRILITLVDVAGQSQVGHFGDPLGRDQDVARFHVAMNQAPAMRISQPQGGLQDDISGLLHRQRAAGTN